MPGLRSSSAATGFQFGETFLFGSGRAGVDMGFPFVDGAAPSTAGNHASNGVPTANGFRSATREPIAAARKQIVATIAPRFGTTPCVRRRCPCGCGDADEQARDARADQQLALDR